MSTKESEGNKSLFLWGKGKDGQLGIRDRSHLQDPTPLDSIANPGWTQIACGAFQSAALSKDGELFTWGNGSNGQLGHGDCTSRHVPTRIKYFQGTDINIIQVACGACHMAALSSNGELFTWGYGGYGRLGHGDEQSHRTPKRVNALADDFIVEVVCGWYHTIAITSKGLIYTWGSTTNGRAGMDDDPSQSPAASAAPASSSSSTTRNSFHSCILKPQVLRHLSRMFVVFVSAHRDHTVCVTKGGEVYSWGDGTYGKLGHGNDSNQLYPKRVEALVGTQIKDASCGRHHTAVRTHDGKVLTFGKRMHGHLDEVNEFVPSLVRPLEGKIISQLQCGDDCVVALTFTGYVYILRIDGSGDEEEEEPLSVPLLVNRLSAHNVVQIATYSEHCAALVNPNPSLFRQHQRAQLNNKKYSDVAFIVENQPIYANIAVLTRKSQYFQAMFRSNMRESIERIVHIPNCSRTAFLKLMEYFYLDGFSVTEEDAVMLFYLSDMYLLDELRMICTSTIEIAMLPD